MNRILISLSATTTLCASVVFGQSVYINSPSPWTSLRTQEIVVKAQLDTAILKKRTVKFTVARISGRTVRQITSKTVKGTEYYAELPMGSAGADMLGGNEYLKISWAVVDTTEKGDISPVGVANIEKTGAMKDSLLSYQIDDNADAAAIAKAMADKGAQKIGSSEYGIFWNAKGIILACKKSAGGSLTFAIEGKNAKAAFLSYPDRFVCLTPANDSMGIYHHKRVLTADSLSYAAEAWTAETQKSADANVLAVVVPWYDMGLIPPFNGRKVGLMVFAQDAKGKGTGSYPAKASKLIPGTWGNLVFVK